MGERISIAMCTYNGEAYLRQQLESICAQTILPSEMIICDDSSQDRTVEIISEYESSSSFPIKLLINEERFGLVKNYEKAISECSGEIILLADQDDYWHQQKIETMLAAFREKPRCGYVFSNALLVDEKLVPLGRNLWQAIGFVGSRYRQYVAGNQLSVMLRGGNIVYGNTLAFRARYMNLIVPIDSQSFSCAHDTWISLILSAIGASGVPLPQNLLYYRQHTEQAVGVGFDRSLLDAFSHAYRDKRSENLMLAAALENVAARCTLNSERDMVPLAANELLMAKIMHLQARAALYDEPLSRKWKIVAQELASGRYHKYSGSCKSAIRDLIIS